MSTRDVLRRSKPKIHSCEISNGTVYVRSLSGAGRAAYLALVKKHESGAPPSHEIAALGLCDEEGTPCYDTQIQKDLEELAAVDGSDLQKIAMKIFEVSGLTEKAKEEAEKNS